MKVLFVCSGNVKSFEVVPFIKEQGESLRRLGIDVDYYPVVGKGLLSYLRVGLQLRKYLKGKSYDLIHGHFIFSGWVAVIGAGRTPVVLSLMGSDAYGEYVGVNKVRLSSRINTLLTFLIQPFVRAIISKAPNIQKYVYLKSKSYLIPNGIDRDKFFASAQDYKEELELNPNKQQILFLGKKTNVRKNFALAQRVMGRLNSDQVELINPYPVAHQDIPKYLNAASVLITPSLMEGSPNVVKEAMACNCPIVSTDIGDVSWVMGGTEGCYVASFDEADFTEKVKRALAFSKTVGRTSGELQISKLGLDAQVIARRVEAVYQKVLGTSQNPEKTSSPILESVI